MQADYQETEQIPLFDSRDGTSPLVISAPHAGTHIPADIAAKMNETGLRAGETDFHVHRLFDFAPELDASTVWARWSRYVIDLNRDPDGAALYPGRFETPLCPLTDFDRNPIYREGAEPDAAEAGRRLAHYYRPYHERLRALLDLARARHGFALLIDAHSIRPSIPALFDGSLPDLNFGTNDGRSCPSMLRDVLRTWAEGQGRWSHVIDGRFKGGFTTRHYGRPSERIYALQIEIVQDAYLNMTAPDLYDEAKAAPLSRALRSLIERLMAACHSEGA